MKICSVVYFVSGGGHLDDGLSSDLYALGEGVERLMIVGIHLWVNLASYHSCALGGEDV
jgi:hypothetical protein